jgi:hypothetical protein
MPEPSATIAIADPSKGIKVDATAVATPFRDEIKAKVADMKARGIGTFMLFRTYEVFSVAEEDSQ